MVPVRSLLGRRRFDFQGGDVDCAIIHFTKAVPDSFHDGTHPSRDALILLDDHRRNICVSITAYTPKAICAALLSN
jgi:hypothetical protein